MVVAKLRSFFSSHPRRGAQEVYIALVRQSRKVFFYTDCAVPDSFDGRFEVIVLHVFLELYQRRGRAAPDSAPRNLPREVVAGNSPEFPRSSAVSTKSQQWQFSRLLLECLYDDMDRNLREMGVGDMGVGKRVKTMSRAAFGRLEAYTQAYDDDDAMREALMRNVYRGTQVRQEAVEALLQYIRTYAAAP